MNTEKGGETPPNNNISNFYPAFDSVNSENSMNEREKGTPDSQALNIDKGVKQIKNPVFYSLSANSGPFIVYLESTEKVGFNIGKSNSIKIARDVFNLNLTNVSKINNKGLNRISIEFLSAQSANNFVCNKTLLDKGYKIYIPFNF
mgnify:FL=1